MHQHPTRLRREFVAEPPVRDPPLAVDVLGQDRVAALGEYFGQLCREGSLCSARIRMRVCGCTPSTAEITSTAPSSTLKARSTSAMKSGWPGVSIRLTVTSLTGNDTTADLIVMPRCCSSASESVWVVPSSTLPISSMTPAAWRSRSVRVVLPASTCARIPRLSVFRDTRHTLRIGLIGLLDGHERSAHLRSFNDRRWLVEVNRSEE